MKKAKRKVGRPKKKLSLKPDIETVAEVVIEPEEPFLPPSMIENPPTASTKSVQNNPGLLENTLQTEVEQEHHVKSVSKELFNKENIDLKTEVSHDEINHITKIRFLQNKFEVDNVDILLKSFLNLRVSKKRQSRREFIDALQTENRNAQGGGFMSKLFGGGNNNNP